MVLCQFHDPVWGTRDLFLVRVQTDSRCLIICDVSFKKETRIILRQHSTFPNHRTMFFSVPVAKGKTKLMAGGWAIPAAKAATRQRGRRSASSNSNLPPALSNSSNSSSSNKWWSTSKRPTCINFRPRSLCPVLTRTTKATVHP